MFNPIYKPKGRALEYCDWAVTIYTGCPHACTYCYVPAILRKSPALYHADVHPRPGIVEAVRRQLVGMRDQGNKIMLCFMCDPYPVGCDSTATHEVIMAIKESGNHVQILTKGDSTAQRDFDLLDAGDSFGITLTGGECIEPRAAKDDDRIASLALARLHGLSTWISCEPVVNTQAVMEYISNLYWVDLWRIGKLNHRSSNIDWHRFGHEVDALCQSLGRNYRIKTDLLKAMEET